MGKYYLKMYCSMSIAALSILEHYRIRPFKRPGRLKKGKNGGRLLRTKSGHDGKICVYNSTTELHSGYF